MFHHFAGSDKIILTLQDGWCGSIERIVDLHDVSRLSQHRGQCGPGPTMSAGWKRGVLPLAAALATLLAIFAAISAPQWLARDKPGFISPTLDNEFLGLVTLLILVLQLLMIVAALVAFRQEWSVELEVGANTVDGGSGDSSQSRPVIPTRVTVDGDIAT